MSHWCFGDGQVRGNGAFGEDRAGRIAVAENSPIARTRTPKWPAVLHLGPCQSRHGLRRTGLPARPGGRLGLVDWEDSGLRDPAREVADLLMHPNQEDLLDWHAWQPFLSTYGESRRDDANFELRLEGYLAIFPVFWLRILLAD